MVMLCTSTVQALTSSLLVVYVAAAPLHHGPHQLRAVDVGALIHNQDRPVPAPKATSVLDARAVNPEGWVPYMHFPSQTADPVDEKRSVNLEGYIPYQHDIDSPLRIREYDQERVPFPRPVPQQQDTAEGDTETNGGGRKRESDPIIDNLLRKPVNVVPIVGRAVDPESFNYEGRQIVDVVPIVGRGVDPVVSDNVHRKPVDVVPIVGRAVDVGAFVPLQRTCGPEAQEYDPYEKFCDDVGMLHPVGAPMAKMPAEALTPDAHKRNAIPEPQTDKMTCNGQRYLPSEQTCTSNGTLVNTQPVTPHNSKFTNPPVKRAISQCGSGIGSIEYDRATEYCDPITQQITPMKQQDYASSRVLTGKPTLIPLKTRGSTQEFSQLIQGRQFGSSQSTNEVTLANPASEQQPPFLCTFAGKSIEYDRNTQVCNARDGLVSDLPDDPNQASRTLWPGQELVRSQDEATDELPGSAKRDVPKSPVKLPFWEYWYDDTYDSDVEGDSD